MKISMGIIAVLMAAMGARAHDLTVVTAFADGTKTSGWRWGQALGKLCAIGLCGIPGAGARREWWGAIV